MPDQTGPTSDDGKAVSRMNATKFGLYSESPVLPNVENEDEWAEHRERTFASFEPDNYLEEALVERVAVTLWRFKRLVRFEREQVRNRQSRIPMDIAMVAMMDNRKLPPEPSQQDADRISGWLMDRLIPEEKEFNLLMRWESRLHRQLLQLLHELEAMKARRRGESAPLARLDIQGIAALLRDS